ncbi:uncharacterized protein K452DRAFT_352640 [Aplosporella prunicola CBS 121167]|uniref:Phosphoglycerate mutase-like protein n=1 Tax=Aplosporella prunicola CBS 121167 TaxID=1176127 RepID=A0A6A6BA70_9PEZI|nr:uncharacterized protein K452DRAFT_352640 [Aplosporella prunicola CBS 121167]KAF2139401.1 hypothetical protein K452DRAFT_352640 [Aplosporella prunicola CBS 121167]
MAPTIHLVRHAQGFHNLTPDNYSMHDPLLTPLGREQCLALQRAFPVPLSTLAAVVASPIKRTIYTALLTFAPTIAAKNLRVVALPELQETSAMPCDTGSPRAELEREFAGQPVDLGLVGEGWDSKTGKWADEAGAIGARAAEARRWLAELVKEMQGEGHVAVVTHGSFLHYLTRDWEGFDGLAGTGWRNTEVRSFGLREEEGGEVGLVETEESRARRSEIGGPSSGGEQATGPAVEEEKANKVLGAEEVSVRA